MYRRVMIDVSRGSTNAADGADAAAYVTPRQAEDLGPRARQTIARIIDATRSVFLTRGYGGTTTDEIARIADVSRASFYTYFASKREVLLAVGAQSADANAAVVDRLAAVGGTRKGLIQWVGEYFEHLDVHGSLSQVWPEASRRDEEVRRLGMRRHIAMCRQLGEALATTAGKTVDDPLLLGLAANCTLERMWTYGELYADTIDRDDVIAQAAQVLWGAARQPVPTAART